MRFFILAALLFAVNATSARAETFPVIQNKAVLKNCGECHMAFPPETLPRKVWQDMMGNLSNHFGEDASIAPGTLKGILAYYVNNASDVSNVRAAQKWRAKGTFARIIDAPRFQKKHGSCPTSIWSHEKIKSKSNCLACHTTMQTNGSTHAKMPFLPANVASQCDSD